MAVACKRLAQFSGFGSSKSFSFKSSLRTFSTNGWICDTSDITRGLEGKGVPTKQAQAITFQESFLQRIEMLQESNLLKFKVEVQRSQMELGREIEKLRNYMETSHNELRSNHNELREAIIRTEITSKKQMLLINTVSAVVFIGWMGWLLVGRK